MESNERWKIDGDCRKCRRQSYCSKPCKKFNIARERALKELVAEKIAERIGGKK